LSLIVFRRLGVVGGLLLVAACVTAEGTPYAPAGGGDYGYSETRIEEDRYRVVFAGDGGTPPNIVENYALLRAAELTVENGFEWFRVVGRRIEPSERGGVRVGGGVGSGSFGRRGGVNVGVGGDFGSVGARTFYTVRLDVLMGSGESPGEGEYYDAHNVIENIGATAVREM